jgi:hypothetical protein
MRIDNVRPKCLAGVVDEDARCQEQTKAGVASAQAVVVVLEEVGVEALVEAADALVDLAADEQAEAGEAPNLLGASAVRALAFQFALASPLVCRTGSHCSPAGALRPANAGVNQGTGVGR